MKSNIKNEKKKFSLRKYEISFIDWFRRIFAYKVLTIISKENNRLRGNIPISVFANDFISNHIVIDGFYEKLLLDNTLFFFNSLKEDTKNWIFFDIGANIGNHSIYFSEHFKEVHAFEPNPIVFQILKINSHYKKNIFCYDYGLGEKKDQLNLNINQNNLGASFIDIDSKNTKNSDDSIRVKIDALDNIRKNYSQVDLIKIDVEGFEEYVLKGGKNFINKFQPIILFEQLLDRKIEEDLNKVSNLLVKEKYELCTFSYPIRNQNFVLRKLKNIIEIIFNKKVIKIDLVKIEKITKEMILSGQCQLIIAVPEKLKNKIPYN